VRFTSGNRKAMAAAKSEKETTLNYTIQPFVRQYFDEILNVHTPACRKRLARILM
jgi:hypothetical protein